MKKIALLVSLVLLLTACQTSTAAAVPTNTPSPSATFTPQPPTSTITPTFSITPTPTYTPTLTPPPPPIGNSVGLVFGYYQRGYSSKLNLKGNSNVFFANVDGSDLRPITTDGLLGNNEVDGVSPDGKQVLIRSSYDTWLENNSHLYIANLDGSNISRLDNNTLNVDNAYWLPNGKIAYIANESIYVVNSDGTGLSKDNWNSRQVYWPLKIIGAFRDRLIFSTAKGSRSSGYSVNDFDIMWMMLDGTGVVRKIKLENIEGYYDLLISPDGNKVVLISGDYDHPKLNISPIIVNESAVTIDASSGQTIHIPFDSEGYLTLEQWSLNSSTLWITQRSCTKTY